MSETTKDKAQAEDKTEKGFFTRLEEWNAIEDLVLDYKLQFIENASREDALKAKKAATKLIQNFHPLFKKYLTLIKTAHIDFNDWEMKRFVLSFIGDPELKTALKKDSQSPDNRRLITSKFNFVRETYGALPADVILIDLQMLLLVLAKRYKQMGYNFCAYVYNAYSYEVSRHVKKFIENPSNIHYRTCGYEDYMQSVKSTLIEEGLIDKSYENNIGIPDMSWVQGTTCSDIFEELSPIERKIIIKYYLEEYNDRQIAEEMGLHINTINQKRRHAVAKLAELLDIDLSSIRRSRNSGKNILARAFKN